MFYDIHRVLSYNALLNILVGERGVGKTYSVSKFSIEDFIKHENEFAYIRRYKPELKKAVPNFFSALISNEEFKEHSLFSKGNSFYCDDKICGHAMTLSTAQDLKSSNFNKVKNIIFDEFIIEEGQRKYYLNNEVVVFLNLIETIARLRDVRIFLLANAVTATNPYFIYFDLSLPYNNDIKTFKNGTILVQYMKNMEYREVKKKSKFGELVKNTSFEDYAINNNFMLDDKNFIEKKTGSAKFSFAFVYNTHTFGVWFDYLNGRIFVSDDYIKNTPYLYSCTLHDHTPNTMLIQSAKKHNCWRVFLDNYKMGNVRFENQKIKNLAGQVIKLMLTK